MNRNHNGKNHHQQELMYSLARWFFSNFDPTSNPRNLQLDSRNPTIIRNFGPKKTHGKNSHYPKNIVSLGLSCVFPIEPNAIRRQFWKFESSEKSIWATKKTYSPIKLGLYIWRSCYLHPKLFKSEKFGNPNSTRIFWEQNPATTKSTPKKSQFERWSSFDVQGGLGRHVAQLLRTTNCGSENFLKENHIFPSNGWQKCICLLAGILFKTATIHQELQVHPCWFERLQTWWRSRVLFFEKKDEKTRGT